jgi:hypothetical protein
MTPVGTAARKAPSSQTTSPLRERARGRSESLVKPSSPRDHGLAVAADDDRIPTGFE